MSNIQISPTQQYVYATYVLTNKLDSESCFLNVNCCPLALYTPELLGPSCDLNHREGYFLLQPGCQDRMAISVHQGRKLRSIVDRFPLYIL